MRRLINPAILFMFAFCCATMSAAQEIKLLKDINANPTASPQYLTNVNNRVIFTAVDSIAGAELWVTDGTTAGTVLLKDLMPGPASTDIRHPYYYNGFVYFSANDYSTYNGAELWRTDGTPSGTTMVKNIFPGKGGSFPENLFEFNGKLYFSANDSTYGAELWVTDGTANGTMLVKDINSGRQSSNPEKFCISNGILYFMANNYTNGTELWKTDGTSVGTTMVIDLEPGLPSSQMVELMSFNNQLFFIPMSGANKEELWKTDGTSQGTVMVKDINPGGAISVPRSLTEYKGLLYFSANDGTSGRELWRTDGTTLGTALFKDVNAGAGAGVGTYYLRIYNNELYFPGNTVNDGYELWKTDGTANGTVLVKDIDPGTGSSSPGLAAGLAIEENGILYFVASTSTHGNELWRTDGTSTGTYMVDDIFKGAGASYPSHIVSLGSKLIFTAADSNTFRKIWYVCPGINDSVTFNTATKELSAMDSGLNYQWLNCSTNQLLGVTTQTYTPVADGSYAVILSEPGCSDTSDCITVTGLDVNTVHVFDGISIYPNPVTDHFIIDAHDIFQPVQITIMDLTGRKLEHLSIHKAGKTIINTSEWCNGIYLIETKAESMRATFKLMKN